MTVPLPLVVLLVAAVLLGPLSDLRREELREQSSREATAEQTARAVNHGYVR